jgi:hypothetical protein
VQLGGCRVLSSGLPGAGAGLLHERRSPAGVCAVSRRHEWTTERSSPGIIKWECHLCEDQHMMTWVSVANPERLRSMIVILESACPGTPLRRVGAPIVSRSDVDLAMDHLRKKT